MHGVCVGVCVWSPMVWLTGQASTTHRGVVAQCVCVCVYVGVCVCVCVISYGMVNRSSQYNAPWSSCTMCVCVWVWMFIYVYNNFTVKRPLYILANFLFKIFRLVALLVAWTGSVIGGRNRIGKLGEGQPLFSLKFECNCFTFTIFHIIANRPRDEAITILLCQHVLVIFHIISPAFDTRN